MARPEPFTLRVPDAEIDDLKVRLAHAPAGPDARRPPRYIAERTYSDIRRWTPMKKGGHFAAMEQPAALAADVRAFFSGLARG